MIFAIPLKKSAGCRVFLRDICMIEPRHRRYGNIIGIAAFLPEPILVILYCLPVHSAREIVNSGYKEQ